MDILDQVKQIRVELNSIKNRKQATNTMQQQYSGYIPPISTEQPSTVPIHVKRNKKIRRGKRIKNKFKNFIILYLNIRGIKQKIETLEEVYNKRNSKQQLYA